MSPRRQEGRTRPSGRKTERLDVRRTQVERPRLLFLVTEDWYFWSHRRSLARAARAGGFEVAVAMRLGPQEEVLAPEGVRVFPLEWDRASANPARECATLLGLTRIVRDYDPTILHCIALKPILYGSIVARWAGVPHVVHLLPGIASRLAGVGGKSRQLPGVLSALRWCLRRANTATIFQNGADRDLVFPRGCGRFQVRIIPGSGVDTEQFPCTPLPTSDPPMVLMVSRLLRNKGVAEFVAAARILREKGCSARFRLVGSPDPANLDSIPPEEIERWVESGMIEWLGRRSDIAQQMQAATIVVLPSWAEGAPRVLLEASASGRPVVATDIPGCRQVVRHLETGLLVPPRQPAALAGALGSLIGDRDRCIRLGLAGRALVESELSDQHINRATLALYRELLGVAETGAPA